MKYQSVQVLRNRMRFPWSQISRMLLVSRATLCSLWRRVGNIQSFSSRYHWTTHSSIRADRVGKVLMVRTAVHEAAHSPLSPHLIMSPSELNGQSQGVVCAGERYGAEVMDPGFSSATGSRNTKTKKDSTNFRHGVLVTS